MLPSDAASLASLYIALKFLWLIASLSNIASDRTTEDAPQAIYSLTESEDNKRYQQYNKEW